MNNEPVKIGLIGFGAWGKCHAEAIRATTGAELVAIAAKSTETRADAQAAFPSAHVCADFCDLLLREDVDLVDIVLPSCLHYQVAAAALRAGKHVLLEKPMCLVVSECDELIELAHEHHCLLAIGHELRLSSLWSRVKEMIAEGFVGEPLYVLVELSRKPYRRGAEGWRYDIERVGNWILEEPIHFFDLARWYLQSAGEPVSVVAAASSHQPGHPELQDNFSSIVQFEGGAYAVVTQTLAMFEHHQMVKVAGSQGSLWASWSGAMDRTRHPTFFLKASQGDSIVEIPINKITGEVFELEDQFAMLVRAVRRGEPLRTTGTDGKWSVALCVASQTSVETGRRVKLSDVM